MRIKREAMRSLPPPVDYLHPKVVFWFFGDFPTDVLDDKKGGFEKKKAIVESRTDPAALKRRKLEIESLKFAKPLDKKKENLHLSKSVGSTPAPIRGKPGPKPVFSLDNSNNSPFLQKRPPESLASKLKHKHPLLDQLPPISDIQSLITEAILSSKNPSLDFEEIYTFVQSRWDDIKRKDGSSYASDCRRALQANLRNKAQNMALFRRDPEHEERWMVCQTVEEAQQAGDYVKRRLDLNEKRKPVVSLSLPTSVNPELTSDHMEGVMNGSVPPVSVVPTLPVVSSNLPPSTNVSKSAPVSPIRKTRKTISSDEEDEEDEDDMEEDEEEEEEEDDDDDDDEDEEEEDEEEEEGDVEDLESPRTREIHGSQTPPPRTAPSRQIRMETPEEGPVDPEKEEQQYQMAVKLCAECIRENGGSCPLSLLVHHMGKPENGRKLGLSKDTDIRNLTLLALTKGKNFTRETSRPREMGWWTIANEKLKLDDPSVFSQLFFPSPNPTTPSSPITITTPSNFSNPSTPNLFQIPEFTSPKKKGKQEVGEFEYEHEGTPDMEEDRISEVGDDLNEEDKTELSQLQILLVILLHKAGGIISFDQVVPAIRPHISKIRRRDGSFYNADPTRAVQTSLSNVSSTRPLFAKDKTKGTWALTEKSREFIRKNPIFFRPVEERATAANRPKRGPKSKEKEKEVIFLTEEEVQTVIANTTVKKKEK